MTGCLQCGRSLERSVYGYFCGERCRTLFYRAKSGAVICVLLISLMFIVPVHAQALTNPVSSSLVGSANPPNPVTGSLFTVAGKLTANGVGLPGEKLTLVPTWNVPLVTLYTGFDGSFSHVFIAPAVGPYNVQVFFLGDYGPNVQYLPSVVTAHIVVVPVPIPEYPNGSVFLLLPLLFLYVAVRKKTGTTP